MVSLIFVVEDEGAFVDVFEKLFKMIDAETIDWAFSGEEAIEKIKDMDERLDLVIMDQRLPAMNGVDCMIKIHGIRPDAKVLFVSADESAIGTAMKAGAVDFIRKPFGITEFVETVKKHLPPDPPENPGCQFIR